MHWHLDKELLLKRARQARLLADSVGDDMVRGRLRDVAADYETIARRLSSEAEFNQRQKKDAPRSAKPIDLAERMGCRNKQY